jgi:formylglycine-generating enzyme required for sulfatase activity
MGSEKGERDEVPLHKQYLPEFQIARVPITNAQYALYIRDSGAKEPDYWRGGQIPAGLENHPVVGVSWHDSMEYCLWLSQKIDLPVTLPNEVEWEKAARGDKDQREYPWGEWMELHCNSMELGIDSTAAVGLFLNGISPFGVLDMSGNVWEWTRSILQQWNEERDKVIKHFGYPYLLTDGREDPATGNLHSYALRGGAFDDPAGCVRCAYRMGLVSNVADNNIGFRVVIPPSAAIIR